MSQFNNESSIIYALRAVPNSDKSNARPDSQMGQNIGNGDNRAPKGQTSHVLPGHEECHFILRT